MTPPPSPFRLRDRIVTPARNIIAGPEGETGIEPKIMQVLCVLASEPGRVFSRAELIDKVWGTEYGADESLTRAISLLRKALGDTRSEPAMIETIAKRGYRLLPSALAADTPAQVKSAMPLRPSRRAWIAGAGAAAAGALGFLWWRESGRPDGIPVIVLPVNAIRREGSQTSLAAALTVDLVGLLAKEKRFHVTVRDPDPATKGRRRYSIYADLQTAEGRVRTHVEIMDIDTGQALWSRLYERPYDGKLSSQSALSAAITRDLTAALLGLAGVPQ
ncbi:MAG TPA: winged helix-turn-helix domain-containing protein [Rhizomicrobium sp.]|jgi:DNA-binding winged helix-turn-helix (wHTH) protein/TolB-like protein|nr:winged helix-turn-helix domain-containing protein [Rhizomicrobium sp.]